MASIAGVPASPVGLSSPLFPSQRLRRPCSRESQNPLSRAAAPRPGGARSGLLLSPSASADRLTRNGTPRATGSPCPWHSIYDNGHAALGPPFCSPRSEMDVRFGLYERAPSPSDLARRAQICVVYGGGRGLPGPYGPSPSDVQSARRLVHEYVKSGGTARYAGGTAGSDGGDGGRQQPRPRPVKRLIRRLGASASLEQLERPLDVVGNLRWAEAMSKHPRVLLQLREVTRVSHDEPPKESHAPSRTHSPAHTQRAATAAVAREENSATSSPHAERTAEAATASRLVSRPVSRSVSRPMSRPASREFDVVADPRWWDDSMSRPTVRLLPEKDYGKRVGADDDDDE